MFAINSQAPMITTATMPAAMATATRNFFILFVVIVQLTSILARFLGKVESIVIIAV